VIFIAIDATKAYHQTTPSSPSFEDQYFIFPAKQLVTQAQAI